MLFNILKKDLKLLLRDKEFIMLVILMPIVIISILSFALSGMFDSTIEINKFKVAVVKEYNEAEFKIPFIKENDIDLELMKEISADEIFFDKFLNQKEIKDIMNYEILTWDEAEKEIKKDTISAIIILDEDFEKNLAINFLMPLRKEINIRLIKNPVRSLTPQITEEILSGFNDKMNQILISKNILIEKLVENGKSLDINFVEKQIKAFQNSSDDFKINISKKALESRDQITSKAYYSAAMLSMFLLFVAGIGSSILLDEKRQMTYDRLIISGVSKRTVLLGKYFTIFSLAILECIVVVMYSSIILKVEWGNSITLLISIVVSSITVASFGLMIAIISFQSDNRKLAVLLNSVIFQVMSAIGGSFIPVEALPKIIQSLRFIPFNGVILNILLNNMQALSYKESLFEFGILLINTIIFLAISFYIMNKGGNKNEKRIKTSIN
jgi:ABC-2 type transport system permease protein